MNDIKMKVLMLKGAKGDTGNTMGKLQKLAGTATILTAGTTDITIPISAYNPDNYALLVYMNGLILRETQDYTIVRGTDTHRIKLVNKIDVPSYGGDIFTFVAFRVVAAS